MNNFNSKTYCLIISIILIYSNVQASIPNENLYTAPPVPLERAAAARYAASAPVPNAAEPDELFETPPVVLHSNPSFARHPQPSAPPFKPEATYRAFQAEKKKRLESMINAERGGSAKLHTKTYLPFNPYAELLSGFALGALMCGEFDHPNKVDKKLLTWRRAFYVPAFIAWQLLCSKIYPHRTWNLETGVFWGTGWLCGLFCKHPEALEIMAKLVESSAKVAKNIAKIEAYRRTQAASPTCSQCE